MLLSLLSGNGGLMTGNAPTAKELHAAIEGLRQKARQLSDELAQTNAKIAALERVASEQSDDVPSGGSDAAGQK